MGHVYFLANKFQGTIYLGVTSNLMKRVWEHKNSVTDGFSSKYKTTSLVYYEMHDSIEDAIKREKQLKNWKREWKIRLIEKENPNWVDLYNSNLIE